MRSIHRSNQRAVALIIVLAFLVLVAGLILAFFSSVQTESAASHSYQGSVTVRQLNATATSIVTGQISDATHSQKVPGEPGGRIAWASQPGMIRTWDDQGKGWKIFKLYSARDMVTKFRPDGTYSVKSELPNEVPDNWPSQKAHFVDLNRPEIVADPDGAIVREGRKYRASYPIVDPLASLPLDTTASGKPIDGFKIDPMPPGYGGPSSLSVDMDPSRPQSPNRSGNPAAMPVRWIYVLKDGTLTVPTGSADGGTTATWDGAAAAFMPSKDNPITGRIAFWADDESCKLNINTASEPTPWDTPRAVTKKDVDYGKFQPAMREFQRYPGHPYMTALSPVFYPGKTLTTSEKEELYKLVPRVMECKDPTTNPTTTMGGTVVAKVASVSDSDRLFANVDELLFLDPYLKAVSGTSLSRSPSASNPRTANPLVNAARLRRARFFLTANSRAPEINLYGTPRISLWPEWETASSRTAFDKLAAFCSTTGTGSSAKPFYFQRKSSTSPTDDYQGISRNQALYQYLQRLTDQPVPGYGGSFAEKWKVDRDQVLTEIFDYIRCVNIHDTTVGAKQFAGDNNPNTEYAASSPVTVGEGQVTPIQINQNNTMGFGRYHTISQFGFHFICSQDGAAGAYPPGLPAGERYIEAAFLFTPYSPSLGFYGLYENLSYEVTFQDALKIDGKDLKFPTATKTVSLMNKIGSIWHANGREHGGSGGLRSPVMAFGGGGYPFVSAPKSVKIAVGGSGQKMTFTGGKIQVKVKASGSLVQTFNIDFPGGSFPIPDLVKTGTTDYYGYSYFGGASCATAANGSSWWRFSTRYADAWDVPHAPGAEYADPTRRHANFNGLPAGFKKGGLFRREDVVRSIVPDHGDLRLIAAKKDIVPTDFVRLRPNEWNDQYRFIHIFNSPGGSWLHYGFANEPRPNGTSPSTNPFDIPGSKPDDQLVPNSQVKYHYSRLPEIRPGAGKEYNRWGDFDNGISCWGDGAYINKPDEGNYSKTGAGVNGAPSYAYFAWDIKEGTEVNFSPSRLVPSAGMLGSLPTGVKRHDLSDKHAWETLLFRPEQKDAAGKVHPGALSPKDHLIMDLFWMPAVEPYAISEPFSTAGKINLNYEIAPFNYIRRTTALHGLMKGEEPLVLANAAATASKIWDHESGPWPFGLPSNVNNLDSQVRSDFGKLFNGQAPFDKLRLPIDVEMTLKEQADKRFDAGEIFRSGTEICELHLVRQGEKISDYQSGAIWSGAAITGDNTRERPYTNLYARLTTRSNVFTVHTCVQVLRQPGGAYGGDWSKWSEKAGSVISEYRGSSVVERYIDSSDPNIPDFADVKNKDRTTDSSYKFRTVSTKRFTP